MNKHYLIFIHGIGQRRDTQNPQASYEDLWNRIIRRSGFSQEEFEVRFERIDINWHVGPLENAANTLFDVAFPGLKEQPFNPMRGIRGFMTFFIGDVAAYVSEDVNLIRRTFWEQMWARLEGPIKDEEATYSIVAHSLGSVITFDYLFHLFYDPEGEFSFLPKLDPTSRPQDNKLEEITVKPNEVQLLQKQFRHFFTMGSPIGLFMMRKGNLWINGDPFTTLLNPVKGEGRSWYNFWDSEDAIAYPLEKLFQRIRENDGQKLVDVPVENGFLLIDSHINYWNNRDVAQKIADVITQTTS